MHQVGLFINIILWTCDHLVVIYCIWQCPNLENAKRKAYAKWNIKMYVLHNVMWNFSTIWNTNTNAVIFPWKQNTGLFLQYYFLCRISSHGIHRRAGTHLEWNHANILFSTESSRHIPATTTRSNRCFDVRK